ncbi:MULTISPECIES: transcription initiation factor IIB family protein [Haloferax]|uniref:Transcription initiation factor IIB n=2 Tax=Haloferax TaxID=2251 RepID=A0A6G1Z6T2_9EURY|nr:MULTISPECIES: TFIIB-type zinc ribbon-containing protein [Haloferax]KAB1185373.1 transcription initiation factor IIB 2 [Haloferax sp. CBA1149]MRW82014.1 transcription initiation factor IIB 2 [Haloferax marinisediminis]
MSSAEINTEREQFRQTITEKEVNRKEHTECPECGGHLTTDAEHAETTCATCGLVVDENHIDRGPEWRAYDASEEGDKSRVGAPTTKLLHDKGLSSHIGWENRDSYGNALSSRQRQQIQRLRTWDERFRTRDHKERNLKQALGEIDRMGSALGLSDEVRETASVIYRRALESNLLPGRTIEGIATASLYAAARQMKTPRSILEVDAVSRVDEIEFKRAYRYIVRELGLAVMPASPQQYVGRLASELDIDSETERLARDMLKVAEGTGAFTGKSPIGLAAAAIYAAGRLADKNLTQDEVSDVADVSTVTIRNRYQELLDVYEEDQARAARN